VQYYSLVKSHVVCAIVQYYYFVCFVFKPISFLLQQYIHSRILTKLLMHNSNNPDGIVYHSIADLGSYNIALPAAKADELMKCDQTALIKVKRVFSYGIFDFDIIKSSKGFTENGNILW